MTSYAVQGANLAAVMASIRANGPSSYAANARWNTSYAYQSTRSGGDCKISELEIKVDGRILMPEWRNKSNASASDQAGWDRMYATLLRHEEGHIQHGREFAVLLREYLSGIGWGCHATGCEMKRKQSSIGCGITYVIVIGPMIAVPNTAFDKTTQSIDMRLCFLRNVESVAG